MSDLIERLRGHECNFAVYDEAADRLEQLTKDLEYCSNQSLEFSELIVAQREKIERLRAELDALYSERHLFATQAAEHKAEIERLETENWQLKQACGYPIPADKETPQNPFRCGICDARGKHERQSAL